MADKRISQLIERVDIANNDVLPIVASGATTTNKVTISTIQNWMQDNLDVGVTSVGITLGSSGTDVNVTGSPITTSGNITINIPTASATNRGLLSSADWNTFTNQRVPYTGATGNVNLGEYGISSGFVTLDTTPTGTPASQGTIYWDDSRSTAALIMNGTTQHIGQDSFFYVKNSTGYTIPKGTGVGFAGTDGASGHLLIQPFLANGSQPSTYFMGVTAEAITNGGFGQVMQFGELSGVNTSGYSAGALLYASTSVAGAFQTTEPQAPNNIILVAAAVNSTNNGSIIVRPQIGSNIKNDEGVKITSVADKDLLQYQSGTGLWENKTRENAGIVTTDTSQAITATKQFTQGLSLGSAGGTNQLTVVKNIGTIHEGSAGSNIFGFNNSNNIYFGKGLNNGGVITWSNSAVRSYALPDASGTIALTSNIPANIVTGTLATGQVAFGTAANTVGGDNGLFWDNTNKRLGVGTNTPAVRFVAEAIGAGIGTVARFTRVNGGDSHSFNFNIDPDNKVSEIRAAGTVNGSLSFATSNSERWRITSTGILQSNGAQTIQTSTGNLTLATAAGNGNIVLSPHGTGAVTLTGALNGTSATFTGEVITNNGTNSTNGIKVISSLSSSLFTGGIEFIRTTVAAGSKIEPVRDAALGGVGLKFMTTANNSAESTGTYSTPLTLAPTGAATFSSSVTAGGNVLVPAGSGLAFTGDATRIMTPEDNVSGALIQTPGIIRLNAGGSNRMTITASGNVGIGTASPGAYRLYLQGNNAIEAIGIGFNDTGTNGRNYTIRSDQGSFILADATGSAERMRITSGGAVLINTTSTTSASLAGSSTLQVNNEIISRGANAGLFWENRGGSVTSNSNWFGWYTPSSTTIFLYNGASNIASINASTGAYTALSDINKKKDFEESTIGLNEVMALKPTLYRMESDESDGQKELGFIAQEVKEFIPHAYVESGEDENKFIGLNYNPIVAALVKSVQEQQEQIKSLTEQVEVLKSQING